MKKAPETRGRLHRRLFYWFGASILVTGVVVGVTMWLFSLLHQPPWREEMARVHRFVGDRFARVWDDPAARTELAESLSSELRLSVRLEDTAGTVLADFGASGCRHPTRFEIERDGAPLGVLLYCANRREHSGASGLRLVLFLAVLFGVLWTASGVIAKYITRPLSELADVAHRLGTGQLDARAEVPEKQSQELAQLAEALNDMAARIEAQLRDQRMLLAAVSHELRTPLGHLRLLVELARSGQESPQTVDKALFDIDREIVNIDRLVGDLLASSRLEFESLTKKVLDPVDLARDALTRAGLSESLLDVVDTPAPIEGDASLLGRALANLIRNAEVHGAGLERLRVRMSSGAIVFEAEDSGPGVLDGDETKIFEAFFRRGSQAADTSLGLGLALVAKTAEAHGGEAFAENRPEGGARIGFRVAA